MKTKEKRRNAKMLEVVQGAVTQFRERRLDKIAKLNIRKLLDRKNPYLFRAIGITEPRQLVNALLTAFLSSSDEGSFGNFFYSVAVGVSGYEGPTLKSVDFEIETKKRVTAYVVKSGSYAFNTKSSREQSALFVRRKRKFPRKKFEAVVGYAYGKKNDPETATKRFREVSGQKFWEEISGDPDLYKKIFAALKKDAVLHSVTYEKAYRKTLTRLVKEFRKEFVSRNNKINWNKLLNFNSAMKGADFRK